MDMRLQYQLNAVMCIATRNAADHAGSEQDGDGNSVFSITSSGVHILPKTPCSFLGWTFGGYKSSIFWM